MDTLAWESAFHLCILLVSLLSLHITTYLVDLVISCWFPLGRWARSKVLTAFDISLEKRYEFEGYERSRDGSSEVYFV
jgi:hypothetical protein